jgi:hypothetical protein
MKKMKNRLLLTIACVFSLSSCATIEVSDTGKDVKRIELSDPPITAYPRPAAFAHPEVTMAMQTTALGVCKNGYQIIHEEYLKEIGKGKDALLWEIKCASEK